MLRAIDITKSYVDRVLFANLSFDVGDRDRIALIGANGSGKTTLFDIIAGEILPDSGQIIKRKDGTIGTYMNDSDKKITGKTLLSSGDVVLLGGVWVRFETRLS